MAATGVLPFVRGADLSHNDFSGDGFPAEVAEMTQMTWLKLNRANLERVPDELSRLKNLEHLQMSRNALTSVHGELSDLPCLRSVIVRHNQVKTSGIPNDIFRMKDLTIIDFSHNSLREVPPNLEYAKGAIVLNLGHNTIENIPNQVFTNLIDLLHLDLSNNNLQMLPPQIRRLTELQVLSLSNNPLQHFQLKQLPSMTSLRVLHMRNTQRNLQNIPPTLDNMDSLQDVDLAMNELTAVPDALLRLKNLRKLDLSENQIVKLEAFGDSVWERLETLNLSRNKLKALPDSIVKLTKLKRLYINQNQLNFQGIPAGIGKLVQLEVFHAAYNNLEMVPEGLTRCAKLQRIKLNNNCLITLPSAIHLLPDLRELDLRNNPDLVMPPKPNEKRRAMAFYNIDFSLSNQMTLAGQSPSSSVSSVPSSGALAQRDPVARKIQFLKRRKHHADSDDSANKVIEGMSHIATHRERAHEDLIEQPSVRPPTWQEAMEKKKPRIDYSEVFDEEVGHAEGLWVWEIENFYPNLLDVAFHGSFYEGDCYLILKTYQEDSGSLKHQIYYWIGEKTTLDKGMCAAVHAVNLRNHLGATCRTEREEMNDETDEFLELFGEEIVYIEGGRTPSGFFTVEKDVYPTRLYRASVHGSQVVMQSVPVAAESLDPRFVFLLDAGMRMFVWAGRKSRITVAHKARLFAVKMNKKDRKGKAEIESCNQLKTPEEFWQALLGSPTPPDEPIVEHVSDDQQSSPRPRLYQVRLGMGFLELPQVELKRGVLKHEVLHTKCVYVLDCSTEVYLWVGKRSTRLLKMAGQKIASELHVILARPEQATVSREVQGEESTLFKSKFVGWDDIVPFDFTRTADSVQRRGADIKVIMERDKIKTDLAALFLDRQLNMPHEEANLLMEECNEDLELMEPFVLEGRKFVRLPDAEFGTFYTGDCYVFLCRYYVPPDDEGDSDKSGSEDDEEGEAKAKKVLNN
uniref:Gelsolin-like domain-containing protein n=1 Tax=Plectus sambesii TaxID=2011161 RepID=A0A914W4B2_9BILA